MTSRNRSISRAAAMSIERTTSANSTVTCLYSADRLTCVTDAPHSLQNLELGESSVPHEPHDSPAAASAPRPSSPMGSTSVSCHRWSTMSAILPCPSRHEVLRPSYVVLFQVLAVEVSRLSLFGGFPGATRRSPVPESAYHRHQLRATAQPTVSMSSRDSRRSVRPSAAGTARLDHGAAN